ncbi:MAG: hypothetical protein LBF44_03815, partial [Holosporaceae bacterium]|nr:hypothetical protein [Holosporaceae bacterium]
MLKKIPIKSIPVEKSVGVKPSKAKHDLKKEIDVSIVIPVFNEQENIDVLGKRLLKTMDATKKRYEI